MSLLEGRDLIADFGRPQHGGVRAVDGVSVALEPAQTLGIVGESGSGKSTLAEILGGLLKQTSGSVWFQGRNVAELDHHERREYRRSVQFVFQDPVASMNPAYTIERVLADPQHVLFGRSRRKALPFSEAMLDRVGLSTSVMTRYPRELSGGQCQRVAIARALLAEPSVVVCDECTSALDVSVQAQILNLLADLQQELGTSYLLISHDMGVVAHMAAMVVVMRQGRIAEQGPADCVLTHPQDAYTRALIDAAAGKPARKEAC